MATLYINRPNLELRTDGNTLAVYEAGERHSSIPFKLIERVVIQNTTALDTRVLLKLADAGAATLLLGPRNSDRIALILGKAHNEAAIRIAQAHRFNDNQFVTAFAQELILAKIKHQHQLLHTAKTERPDVQKPLFDAIGTLSRIQQTLKTPITTLGSLRGYEGAAAHAYFQGYAALMPPSLNFTGRNRRPPKDPVNACLSLAYTLLHFDAVRAAHSAGLDPLIGFYHQPSYGRESLASDLIEPLRPHTDAWIWQIFRKRELREEHFTLDKGACLLGKTGREKFYSAWEAHAKVHRRALRARSNHIAQVLRQEGSCWLSHQDDLEAGEQ
jgi:CRISPR-associated protein Cas1